MYALPFFLYLLILKFIRKFVSHKNIISLESHFNYSLTIIVTVHNEEVLIKKRLDNLLQCKAFSSQHDIKIIVASDHCTDGTDHIVRGYADQGVKLIINKSHPGKTAAQISALAHVPDGLVAFTDAGTIFEVDCLNEVFTIFKDSKVGGCTGNLILSKNSSSLSLAQRIHWFMETETRNSESELGILFTGTGALLVIKRDLISYWDNSVGEDCELPLQVIAKGYFFRFAPNCVVFDSFSGSLGEEAKARQRMVLRNLTGTVPYVMKFMKSNNLSTVLGIICHKFLKWFSPFLGIIIVLLSLASSGQLLSQFVLSIGAFCIVMIVIGIFWNNFLSNILVAFVVVNFSFLSASYKYFFGLSIRKYK